MHQFHLLRRTLLLLSVVFLAACPPAKAKAPAPFTPVAAVAADTLKVSGIACEAAEPTVSCRATVAVTVGGQAVPVTQPTDVSVGSSVAFSAPLTCVPLQVVSVTVSLRGLNRSGQLSAPVTASGQATCADGAPTVPQGITIQLQIVKPGG